MVINIIKTTVNILLIILLGLLSCFASFTPISIEEETSRVLTKKDTMEYKLEDFTEGAEFTWEYNCREVKGKIRITDQYIIFCQDHYNGGHGYKDINNGFRYGWASKRDMSSVEFQIKNLIRGFKFTNKEPQYELY